MSKKGKRKMAEENGDDIKQEEVAPEHDQGEQPDPALYPADVEKANDPDEHRDVEPSLPPPPYTPPEKDALHNQALAGASSAPQDLAGYSPEDPPAPPEIPSWQKLPENLDDRAERNLVVKALAKAALAVNKKVGWADDKGEAVLTIFTDSGPLGFHFSKEEQTNFPGIQYLEEGYVFDGCTDEQRADRLNRLVLK